MPPRLSPCPEFLQFSSVNNIHLNMKHAILLIIAALAARCCASTGGFLIDHDLPDGNYRVTLAEDGSEDHLVKRWEPVVRRWQPVPLAKRMNLKRPHWIDHATGIWHFLAQWPSAKHKWFTAGQAEARPPHFVDDKGTPSDAYTFIVDDDTGTFADLSVDLPNEGELPMKPAETRCVTNAKYSTMMEYGLDPADYYASKQGLYNWCDVYRFENVHIEMALRGTVAVYVCQETFEFDSYNSCSEAEYEWAEIAFNNTCGDGPAWSYFAPPFHKRYGRTWKGERVCTGETTKYRHQFWHHHIDEHGIVKPPHKRR